MRFVATKTAEQQSCLMLHRTRHLFIRQQTAVINAIRAHLAEFGIVAPVGRNGVEQLLGIVADCGDKRLPDVARACVAALGAQLRTLKAQILGVRSPDHGLAPLERDKQAARCGPAVPASKVDFSVTQRLDVGAACATNTDCNSGICNRASGLCTRRFAVAPDVPDGSAKPANAAPTAKVAPAKAVKESPAVSAKKSPAPNSHVQRRDEVSPARPYPYQNQSGYAHAQ
jgi:hypothetical protein